MYKTASVKLFFSFMLLITLLIQSNTLLSQEYQLVWADEFDGSELDLSKWEYMIGDGTAYGLPSGWGNNELEYYRAENATIENGKLVITAKKKPFGGKSYTSARIRTINKGDWTYARFEFRAKLPIGQGLWTAIWMLPTDNVYGGWAASGEIDIMEHIGHEPNTVHGTLHYGGQWPNNTSGGDHFSLPSGDFNEDFHTFVLEWEEGVVRWFVDDSLYQTRTNWFSTNGNYPAPFDQRFHLLFNLAVGGTWPGYPNTSTSFPQTFEIEYVRVYQKGGTSAVKNSHEGLPAEFTLFQNYPNPFNPSTIFKFVLSESGNITLKIYNLSGQLVATPLNGFKSAGNHEVKWTADGLPSGLYYYKLQTENYSEVKKLILYK